jgi:hypothetical protein
MALLIVACDNKNLPDFMKSSGALATDTVNIEKPYKDLIITTTVMYPL